MERPIAVVDASVGDTPAERTLTRDIDAVTTGLHKQQLDPEAVHGASAGRYDGVVVGNPQTSVYDDHDWIHALTSCRGVHRADVPVFGICWGHQFLAQSLDGRVVDVGEYELGYRTVGSTGSRPEGWCLAFYWYTRFRDDRPVRVV